MAGDYFKAIFEWSEDDGLWQPVHANTVGELVDIR